MALTDDLTKIRELANRIGTAGRAAPITGELDPVAVSLDIYEAFLKVIAALEALESRVARLEYERRRAVRARPTAQLLELLAGIDAMRASERTGCG